MANEKRKRSANWMASEKSLLVDLVTEHFHVIENKRTDGVSMKQKLGEWKTISSKYNSQTMLSHRTADNLKAQWESLKKSTKKEAYKRMQLIQTGEAPPTSVIEDPLQQKILCLLAPCAVGLHSPYDSDPLENKPDLESLPDAEEQNKYSTDSAATSTVPVIEDCIMNENIVKVVLVPTPANMSPHPQAQVMTSKNNDTSEETNTEYTIVDWGDYTHKNLKTPISKPILQCSTEGNRRPTVGKRLEWMSKRRPQLSNSSIKKLIQIKGNTLTTQRDHAAREREAKELFDIQMEIQREILKQEKIKTRLLLLELRRNKINK